MKDTRSKQKEIRSWFDNTYKRRGLFYLRPKQAYHIYPKLLGVRPGMSILDVACGPGLLLSVAHEKGLKTYGVDISQEAVEISNGVVPCAAISRANGEALPFPDNTFDFITCLGSLERFIHMESVLSEQMRVAKDDALFCYLVRNSQSFTWKFFMQFLGMQSHRGHQGAKTLPEWKNIFSRSGFEIVDIFHDHWPYLRIIRWITLGSKFIDYGKVRKNILPVHYASEFIFILRKQRNPKNADIAQPNN
jgi:ubiquinone/menaquinone biosynthesis C-methylase UbiE